jgi:hypothetical protein
VVRKKNDFKITFFLNNIFEDDKRPQRRDKMENKGIRFKLSSLDSLLTRGGLSGFLINQGFI